ncbi:hypothetical protein V6N13_114055 [Hibiscus sabdariffa]|uniref:X8 domain-containing protein n=1 Tax=Hibiscus sabdariffa TaxID=183260 RepID=A0ABR2U0P3_9ROSI
MSSNLFLPLFLSLCLIFVSLPQFTAQRSGRGTVVTELWCVAKNNAEDAALQGALDWACGQGGADCGPIQQVNDFRVAIKPFDLYMYILLQAMEIASFLPVKTVNNASISEASETLGVGIIQHR